MVSFDFSFRSMFTNEIVEDEGELSTEVRISWLSIKKQIYQHNRLKVVDKSHFNFFGIPLGETYHQGRSFERLVAF